MPAARTSSAATERLRRRWCPSDPRPCRVELRCSTTAHHREDSHVPVSRLDASAYRSRDLPRSFTNASHLGANVEADARRRRYDDASRISRSWPLLVVILGGIGIGVGAYNAGERNGIAQGIEQVQVAQDERPGSPGRPRGGRRAPRLLPGVLPVPAVPDRDVLPDRRDLPRSRPLGPAARARARPVERRGPAPVRGACPRVAPAEHGDAPPPPAHAGQAERSANGRRHGCLRPVRRERLAPMQRILVVEDEMQIARTLRDYLEVAGFEVTVVGDGEPALASARGDAPGPGGARPRAARASTASTSRGSCAGPRPSRS